MKKYSEASVLIAINALKNIITIFLGPFLTAYFIKVSTETLIDLSLYNIMRYLVLAVVGLLNQFDYFDSSYGNDGYFLSKVGKYEDVEWKY